MGRLRAMTLGSPPPDPTMANTAAPANGPGRLALLDVVRGMTILWITLFHFCIDTWGAAGVDARPGRFVAALGRGDLAEGVMVAARASAASRAAGSTSSGS
jgi:hypothetical protein